MINFKLRVFPEVHLKAVSVVCLFIITTSLAPLTFADLTDRLYLSGFGTIGYGLLSEEGPEYRLGQASDGATSDGTFVLDTRLGFQLDANLHERASATVQAIARDDQDGDFVPELEWAFLRANLSDSWSIRVGRMALPSFNVSDFREVGYTNDLVRPPEDTYLQIPIRRFQGIDLISRRNATIDATDIVGGNISFSRGFARWRISYLQTELAISFDGITPDDNPFEPAAVAFPLLRPLVDSVAGAPDTLTISGISMELDFDRIFVDVEYTRLINEGFLTNTDGWYVAAPNLNDPISAYQISPKPRN